MDLRKSLLSLIGILVAGFLHADEGMWVIKELNKQNIARMQELGFVSSVDKLYSETSPSVSNAVIIFGNGCTGITVSKEGLVFTNHHCGYSSIQQLSSVEHDYLKDGFVSQSKEEELPVPGLTVRYLKQTIDEVIEEYHKGVILKLVADNKIIGSIRAWETEGTAHVGKLMVHPDYRHCGYGTKLLNEIESYFSQKRFVLFTSTRSINNLRMYQRMGYKEFERKDVTAELEFIYLEKKI